MAFRHILIIAIIPLLADAFIGSQKQINAKGARGTITNIKAGQLFCSKE